MPETHKLLESATDTLWILAVEMLFKEMADYSESDFRPFWYYSFQIQCPNKFQFTNMFF